jgi:hypothetical protein
MNMPSISIGVGLLLIIQGFGFYLGTESRSLTALIPAAIGLPILLLGCLALRQTARKHAAHAAAFLAALGLMAAVGRLVSAGIAWSAASASLVIMTVLCGGFVVLCVKSFLDARRRAS